MVEQIETVTSKSSSGPDAMLDHHAERLPAAERAAVLISDGAHRRALKSALETLTLTVDELDLSKTADISFRRYEIIVADLKSAQIVRDRLDETASDYATLKPSVVAVGPKTALELTKDFDGFIEIPSMLGEVTARLSVVLYSHRALARRYSSALEELSLNRSIFRSVTNGISVANAQLPDLPLMYVNPSFELMTGYSLEEVQGKNCRFLQGDDRDQPGLTLIREAIQQRRSTVAILRNYRKDGSSFWNELTLSPVFNKEGELTHFVGIQLDVSDRVRIETALRESEKLAAVGRLAASISHEINNPLEAVMNLVYLAKSPGEGAVVPPDTAQYLEQADEELRRMKVIAEQSLRFANQSQTPEAVLLNDLVSSVLDVYQARLKNYGVEVHTRLRSTQHLVAFAGELRQLVSNLTNNAIDAMKPVDRRELFVRTSETKSARDERRGVVVTIADSGVGMPPAVQDEVFKAFFSTKGAGGTGLGLWITKGIVERHHGVLRLRSRTTGKSGTVFRIFLPFQAVSGDPSETAGARPVERSLIASQA